MHYRTCFVIVMSVLFRSHFGSRTSQRRGLVPGSGLRPATGQGYPETRTCVSWLLARRCGSEALAWAQTCVGGAGGCGVLYPCLMEPSASTTVHPTLERGGADPPAANVALPSTPPGASASALNQEGQPPWLAAAASEGAAFAAGATQMALTVMERVNRWQNTQLPEAVEKMKAWPDHRLVEGRVAHTTSLVRDIQMLRLQSSTWTC